MNAWLNANADGIALLFWTFVFVVLFLIVAMLIERWAELRAERGEFEHLANVTRAKRSMAEDVN